MSAPPPFVQQAKKKTTAAERVAAGMGTPADRRQVEQEKAARRRAAIAQAQAPSGGGLVAASSVPAVQQQTGASEGTEPEGEPAAKTGGPSSVFSPDPAMESEAAALEKHEKNYRQLHAELQEKYDALYHDLTGRDASISDLRTELKDEKAKNLRLQQTNQNLQQSNDHYVRTNTEAQDAQATTQDRATRELNVYKKRAEDLQSWYDGAQSEIADRKTAYDKLRTERDTIATDLKFAQSRIDELQHETQTLANQAPQDSDVVQYLGVINDFLDRIFDDQGERLSPESLRTHLESLQSQAQLHRQSSAASLHSHFESAANNRAHTDRKASLHDELAGVGEELDGSDNENSAELDAALNIPKRRRPSSRPQYPSFKDVEIQRLGERITDFEAQQLLDQAKIRELEKQRADDQKVIEGKNAAIEEKNAAIEKAASEKQRAENEKPAVDEKTPITNGKPTSSPTEVTRTHTKYVEVARDATVWEALMKAPWWLKFFMMLFVLICISLGVAGYNERQMWLEANGAAAYSVRYANAIPGQWNWQYRVEEWLGMDTTMLG